MQMLTIHLWRWERISCLAFWPLISDIFFCSSTWCLNSLSLKFNVNTNFVIVHFRTNCLITRHVGHSATKAIFIHFIYFFMKKETCSSYIASHYPTHQYFLLIDKEGNRLYRRRVQCSFNSSIAQVKPIGKFWMDGSSGRLASKRRSLVFFLK